ncbi:MAG: uroporphyrinogen-III synthase [Candidatus Bathyarchaeota archaeon BA1]|nr:MAG: uroporphyrinogen-III synthase [Candidatus Bathyarchaeota archaeon BA1]
MKKFINELLNNRVDYVIFMSKNGVTGLTEVLEDPGLKIELIKALNRIAVVAIGPKTKIELENRGVKVSWVPLNYSSEGTVESFRKIDLHKKVVAIPRVKGANQYLRHELEKMKAKVLEVPLYEAVLPSDESRVLRLIDDLFKGKIDIIIFTSSTAVRNLFKMANRHNLAHEFGGYLNRKVIVTVIGSLTQKTLEELGVKVYVAPEEYTVEAMIETLVNYFKIENNQYHFVKPL